MSMTLSRNSSPSMRSCRLPDLHPVQVGPQLLIEDLSFTREDLPEPDTPVTQVKVPRGSPTSMCRRLFSAAPNTFRRFPFPFRRLWGRGSFCARTDSRR